MADRNVIIQGLIELKLAGKGGAEAVASMKEIIAQAKEVEAATKGVGEAAEKSVDHVGALEGAFVRLGETVAAFFAADKIAGFLKDSYLGFAQLERQAGILREQLVNLGGASESTFESVKRFVEETSASSGILESKLYPAMNRALLVFKDVATAQEVVTIASRYAAAGFGDVGTNVERIGALFQSGSARGLIELGIKTKEVAGQTADVVKVWAQLKKGSEDLKKPLDDQQKKIDDLAREYEALSKSVGEAEGSLVNWLFSASKVGDFLAKKAFDLVGFFTGAKAADLDNQMTPGAEARAQAGEEGAFGSKAPSKESAGDRAAREAEEALTRRQRLAQEHQYNQEVLQAQIASAKEGSEQKLALERALLKDQEKAEIENAEFTHAKVSQIQAAFATADAAKVEEYRRNQRLADQQAEIASIQSQAALHEAGTKARLDADLTASLKAEKVALDNFKGTNAGRKLLEATFSNARLLLLKDYLKNAQQLEIQNQQEIADAQLAVDKAVFELRKKLEEIHKVSSFQTAKEEIEVEFKATIDDLERKRKEEILNREKTRKSLYEINQKYDKLEHAAEIKRHTDVIVNAQTEKDRKISLAEEYIAAYSAALNVYWANNKAVAVAEAIAGTAVAIVKSLPNYYLAAAVALTGALEIAKILSTNPGDSGSAPSPVNASGPAPPLVTGGPAVSPPSGSTDSVAGRAPGGSGASVVINARNVWGDRRGVRTTARQIQKALNNDPGAFR